MKDCPDPLVVYDVLGELYFPTIASSETVRVGRRLGDSTLASDRTQRCNCDQLPGTGACEKDYYASTSTESSPRNPGFATDGAIRVVNPSSLPGQVMLNAAYGSVAPSASQFWSGQARSGNIITLTDDVAQPDQAPAYERLSATLGLGAVGLVPFNLHGTDCLPPNGTTGICEIDPYLPNNDKRTVVLRHYGPVSETAGSNPAIVIERQDWAVNCPPEDPPNPPPPCTIVPVWNDVTSCFNVSVAPTSSVSPSNITGEREIWVWPKTAVNSLCPGETWSNRTYRIRPRLSTPGNASTTRVRSDQTLVTVDPPVVYWEYVISLECFDLNLSGSPDMNDVPVFLDQHADYNEDEVVDVQDLNLLVQTIVSGGE